MNSRKVSVHSCWSAGLVDGNVSSFINVGLVGVDHVGEDVGSFLVVGGQLLELLDLSDHGIILFHLLLDVCTHALALGFLISHFCSSSSFLGGDLEHVAANTVGH